LIIDVEDILLYCQWDLSCPKQIPHGFPLDWTRSSVETI